MSAPSRVSRAVCKGAEQLTANVTDIRTPDASGDAGGANFILVRYCDVPLHERLGYVRGGVDSSGLVKMACSAGHGDTPGDSGGFAGPFASQRTIARAVRQLREENLSQAREIDAIRTDLERICPAHRLPSNISLRQIAAAVGETFAIAPAELLSEQRTGPLAQARQAAFWIARSQTRLTYQAIGRGLGRDHSTVMHGVRAAERRRQHDAAYRRAIDRAIALLAARAVPPAPLPETPLPETGA